MRTEIVCSVYYIRIWKNESALGNFYTISIATRVCVWNISTLPSRCESSYKKKNSSKNTRWLSRWRRGPYAVNHFRTPVIIAEFVGICYTHTHYIYIYIYMSRKKCCTYYCNSKNEKVYCCCMYALCLRVEVNRWLAPFGCSYRIIFDERSFL